MNHKIKRKWVAALRSGEYKQCRGVVARYHFGGGAEYCAYGVLTHKVAEFDGPDIELSAVDLSKIVYMNDVQRLSFNEIADHIEQNL